MDGKILARISAVVFIALAVAVAAIGIGSKDEQPDARATRDHRAASQDPLAAELRRCSAIGEAGPRDAGCLKAWADSRRRFLGQRAPTAAPSGIGPTTLFPNVPASADPLPNQGERTDMTAPAMQAGPSQGEVR